MFIRVSKSKILKIIKNAHILVWANSVESTIRRKMNSQKLRHHINKLKAEYGADYPLEVKKALQRTELKRKYCLESIEVLKNQVKKYTTLIKQLKNEA